jgi:hypothetical protein
LRGRGREVPNQTTAQELWHSIFNSNNTHFTPPAGECIRACTVTQRVEKLSERGELTEEGRIRQQKRVWAIPVAEFMDPLRVKASLKWG